MTVRYIFSVSHLDKMAGKRIFLGIPLPVIHEYSLFLQDLVADLDVRLSITNPDNYHFTVHFFGDLSPIQIESAKEAMQDFSFDSFQITLHKGGIIPNRSPNKVRVLYIQPSSNTNLLEELVSGARSKIRGVGFPVPKNKYLPHLTVARVKHGKDKVKLTQRWLDFEFDKVECTVDSLQLIHSNLTSSGPIYTPIYEVRGD